jgi:Fuc2NAc and GlcNAc transferase
MISRSHTAGLIDRPNERSSHTVPTPRGGGVGFVVTFLLAAIALHIMPFERPETDFNYFWWLVPSLAVVSLLGFLDDRFSLRASRRLLVQAAATIFVLTLLFRFQPNDASHGREWLLDAAGIIFALFAFFWMVWLTNLYNFMDGIDGYAALEAVLASAALAAIVFSQDLVIAAALLAFLASSVLGFLILNWSPAKIFMGDAGSTFLGFFFGSISVALYFDGLPIEVTMILLGTFIVDATYTLFMRGFRKQKVHMAHRDHAYQHAVQRGWSHRKTVLVFSSITCFWLMPLAFYTSKTPDWPLRLLMLGVAYLPLVLVQIYFRAGIESPKVKVVA